MLLVINDFDLIHFKGENCGESNVSNVFCKSMNHL